MITGHTKVYGLIGEPVAHSLSPLIHNTFAELTGENIIYCAFPVSRFGLAAAITGARELNIEGLNVTAPHKPAVIPLCASIDETARASGAVNTLLKDGGGYKGFNTDAAGITGAIEEMGAKTYNSRVIIIGAGGCAGAAAAAAAAGGAKSVVIVNRTLKRADKLALMIKEVFGADAASAPLSELCGFDGCDILVNATSVGFDLQAGLSPIYDKRWFKNVGAFIEAVYNPWETKALSDAVSFGVNSVNGFPMLFHQAAASFEIWTGKPLKPDVLNRARAIVENKYVKGENKWLS